jgi:hypothetical protein
MNSYLAAKTGERTDYAKPLGTVPAVIGRASNLPAATGITDPFLAFAQAESGQDILGKLIRFSKGDYIADKQEIHAGTEMVAAVDALVVGWVRWSGKQQVERHLGRIADGFREPERDELGWHDEASWERDSEGRPSDPWQKTGLLPLKRISDGELFTLTLNGRGRGGEAIGRLVGAYGRSRMREDSYPIIKLGVDAYEHKTYGRIKYPILPIVGWRPKAEFGALETGGGSGSGGPTAPRGGDGYDRGLPERIDRDIPDFEDAIPF